MRPPGTPEQLETRRRRAIAMLDTGESMLAVARAVNASVSSVHRWYQACQAKGSEGLAPVPAPGRPPKLSERQRERLGKLLQRGPPAAGYETELWTLRRVADLISSKFGVAYHPCHVWRLLEKMGVDLPEARTPRAGARRSGNRTVATAPMAAYKKTPGGKGVALSLLTKAASCSSRWSVGLGPRRDKRPSWLPGAP